MNVIKKIMHLLLLSCKKATELIEKKHAFGLGTVEKVQLQVHTGMCKACKSFEQQSELLEKSLKVIAEEEKSKEIHISSSVKMRIISAIDQKG